MRPTPPPSAPNIVKANYWAREAERDLRELSQVGGNGRYTFIRAACAMAQTFAALAQAEPLGARPVVAHSLHQEAVAIDDTQRLKADSHALWLIPDMGTDPAQEGDADADSV